MVVSKCPCLTYKPSECRLRCQNLIGSYASNHSTSTLLDPATEIRTHKATEIHTLIKRLTYELFFQNSSIKNGIIAKLSRARIERQRSTVGK